MMSSCCDRAQQSLHAFAVQGCQAEETRAERLARVAAADAIRKTRAEVLGLPWPPQLGKRSVG